MGEWRRDTLWRQGHVLSSETAEQLGFNARDSEEIAVVVISHDCDLAQLVEVEKWCEAIIGRVRDSVDGNFAWAKNARCLHLPFTDGATKLVIELSATEKILIEKASLADHQPCVTVRLAPNELTILQKWLGARYRRASFPDEFERRLKAKPGKAFEKLTDILARTGDHIVAVFCDLDRGRNEERNGPDDLYELTIYVLHSAEDDPAKSLNVATKACKEITEAFQKAFKTGGKWQNIELRGAFPISEEGMTVRQSRKLKRWDVDHLSLRTDSQQPVLE